MVPLKTEFKQVVLNYSNPQDERSTFLRKGGKCLPVLHPHFFIYTLHKLHASYRGVVTYKMPIILIVLFIFGFNFGQFLVAFLNHKFDQL